MVVASFGASSIALAQTGRVVGTVTSADDARPVVGAQVIVVGTQNGSATREDGRYTITAPPGTYRLRVVRLGFTPDTGTVIVTADGTVTRNFALRQATVQLQAVVTQAYSGARQQARDVTGSAAAVDTALFNRGRIVSTEDLIQAKVPGVQVVSSNEPGGGISVRVRGQASINGAQDPLYVIDGIPLPIGGGLSGGRNPLNFLNPNDVQNVTVLKDAQATAIYGSRGANGVVLITTKTGARGGTEVTYGVNYSNRTVAAAPEVLSATQLRSAVQQFAPGNAAAYGGTTSTNWFDALSQNGGGQEHNFAVAGTKQDLQYRLSLGYLDDKGVLLQDRTERVSGQFNYSDRLFNNVVDVTSTLRGVRTRDNFGGGRFLGSALFISPTYPVRNPDGSFFATPNQLESRNPLAQLNGQVSQGQTDRGIGNVQARLNAPFLPGFSATVRGSFDAARTLQRSFTPTTDPSQTPFVVDTLRGSYSQNTPDATTLVLDAFGNYTRRVERFKADLDLTGGYSFETFTGNNSSFSASGLTSNALSIGGIPFARNRPVPSINIQESRLASFFGRANVSMMDRYLLGVSVRRDGSSRFGTNNQWGTFPAVSLGWRLSEEGFAKDRLGPVNDLKLRYSYGLNGNQPTGNYLAYSTYGYSGIFSQVQFGNQFVQTTQPSVANPNLKWEQSATHDVGVDFAMLDGRLTGSADYYTKLTTNLLFDASVPGGSNFNNRLLQNIGSLRNAGVELGLNAQVLRGTGDGLLGRLRYDANLNASANRNKLLSISTTAGAVPEILSGQIGLGGDFVQTLRPGLPLNTFRVLRVRRDASGNPITGPQTVASGAAATQFYVDQNGDNRIDGADLVTDRNPQPNWILGHTSNFGYGRLDLGFTLRAYLGFYTYNRVGADANYAQLQQGGVARNISALVYRYNFVNPQYSSELNVEKADFLRMDNITLGYTLPQYRSLRSTRVFATVQNAFTATGYSGVDPLAGGLGGIDSNTYPLSRIVTLGLNVGF